MPQTRRKKNVGHRGGDALVLKRVKMGKGYRWSYGGKLIPETKAKRIKAARRLSGTKPRTNSAKRSASSTRYVRATTKRKRPVKAPIRKTTPKRRTIKRVAAARANPRRKKASAATRKKISLALKRYHRSTKRASSNPPKKRRKTVAKKTARRRTTRRRTTPRSNPSRPRVGTKAWFAYIGRKGAAARRRKAGKKTTRRKTTRRKAPSRRFKRGATRYSKQRVLLRRKPYGSRVKHRIRRRTYSRKGTSHYRYRIVKRNPGMQDIGNLVKKVLPIYGGMIAARVITGVVDKQVIQQYLVGADKVIKPENAAYAKMAAPALTFLLSVFLGPSVLKGATGGQLLEGLQLGSLVTTFDSILSAVLPVNAKAYIGLTGYDDMGVMGYGGLRGYMADPTMYSLPPAHASLEPGMGLDIHEAMALDAYVPDNGLGLSVEEALADSESDYMQRGGAGGSLSKTVFTY